MDKLICDHCESKQLKAENAALREQLEGLQKRFDQINNFEQSQCAKLLAEIAKRDKTLARVTAERDAAIKYIPHDCETCRHWRPRTSTPCAEPSRTPCEWRKRQAWEWRGPQKEKTKNDPFIQRLGD